MTRNNNISRVEGRYDDDARATDDVLNIVSYTTDTMTSTKIDDRKDIDQQPKMQMEREEEAIESEIEFLTPSSRLLQGEQECYNSTELINRDVANKNPFVQMEVVLCPNTIFKIGFPAPNVPCCVDGQQHIVLRQNTEYRCGENGSRANNCVLTSGHSQLFSGPTDFGESEVNVVLRGITFEATTAFAAFLANSGDIRFIDCAFINMRARTPLLMAVFDDDDDRRLSQETGYETLENLAKKIDGVQEREDVTKHGRQQGRSLQLVENDGHLQVSFIDCLFFNNSQNPSDNRPTEYMLIRSDVTPKVDLYFDNCVFKNNVYNKQAGGRAISVGKGSSLTLENSVFQDNDFDAWGSVTVSFPSEFNVRNNTVIGTGGNVDCPFIAFIADDNLSCTHAGLLNVGRLAPTPDLASASSSAFLMSTNLVVAFSVFLSLLRIRT